MTHKVYFAAYMGKKRLIDKMIRWWTNKPYPHIELVVNSTCYSSSHIDKGVRKKLIDTSDRSKWCVEEIPWTLSSQILDYYQKTKHRKYGYLDILYKQILRTNISTGRGDFCSEWCAAALNIPNASSLNPGELVELIRFITKVYNEKLSI